MSQSKKTDAIDQLHQALTALSQVVTFGWDIIKKDMAGDQLLVDLERKHIKIDLVLDILPNRDGQYSATIILYSPHSYHHLVTERPRVRQKMVKKSGDFGWEIVWSTYYDDSVISKMSLTGTGTDQSQVLLQLLTEFDRVDSIIQRLLELERQEIALVNEL